MMQICHGKQQCQIVADSKTFGSPCRPETRPYLRVLHTCVPLGVLTDRYENSSEEDKVANHYDINTAGEHFDTPDIAVKWNKPGKNSIAPQTTSIHSSSNFNGLKYKDIAVKWNKPGKNSIAPQTTSIHSSSNFNGLKYKDPSTRSSNLKFLIYISIATVIVIILAAIFIGIRYYRKKKRASNSKNGDMFTTEAPNVFNDAASDLDNDGEVSHISGTFFDPVHPDMILYRDGANKATLRAMRPLNTIYPCAGASMYGNVDYVPSHSRDTSTRFGNKEVDSDLMMSPKSLSGYTNSQFYYG
ncbi:jg714 [Pararge aegeria aegeria]|uniref:Jg714 protein n=1 Tax=Pararge aegeria aegeria TaxID=348720 RepID=A0A8S4R9N7_9NEOP|nr:jg714 [Pararge aegeria aegeria]